MHSIFVSDLHLTPDRPRATEKFHEFIAGTAAGAQAVYILGDLFEYWIGDDDLGDPFNASVADALRALSAKGVPLYFMHGNRDVLVGDGFAQRCGAKLITDPLLLDLFSTKTLVMHGDTLCTDDLEYQKFRIYAHDPENQRKFLSQPLAARRKQFMGWRAESEKSKLGKSAEIMDVTPAAVEKTLREHGYPRLIHGHTHRPARHDIEVDGAKCERWVLPDWYGRGGYLALDDVGPRLVSF